MSGTRLELLPAVDIADGRAVQLVQGVAGSGGEFGDPLDAALAWQEQGAEWLHLVDLDAAFGRGSNRELVDTIVRTLDIQVELSGGIRDAESLDAALATGCRRVNVGTAALEHPEWTAQAIADHGDRIAVGLDVRGTTLAARGWTRDGGDLWETLDRLDREGCARYVVTDVNKDGMLAGPNLALLEQVCAADRPSRRGLRRRLDARRPEGAARPRRRRRRGGDHRVGALPPRVHPARGARRGGPAVSEAAADRQRHFSGGVWETAYGYARAMRVGRFVLVSGCTSMAEGRVRYPADPGSQLRVAIETAREALAEFGADVADVVRTRMYVTHRRDCDAVGRVHAEVFGEHPPVATMVIVSGLLHPDMRVEIEVEALLPAADG